MATHCATCGNQSRQLVALRKRTHIVGRCQPKVLLEFAGELAAMSVSEL